MSDEDNTTKGGHAPAEKIGGGVRIARKERVTSSSEPGNKGEENAQGDEESYELEKKSHNELHAKAYLKQIKKDFPEEATRQCHEKPHSTNEPPTQIASKRINHNLFQPR